LTNQLQSYVQENIRFPEAFDIAAIILFALTGVLAAMRRGYDVIGVFILGLVVSAGGGLIRDGLFLQDGPPALTQNWRFLPAVGVACLIGWIIDRWIIRFQKVIAVLDAVGLSAYSMVGLIKSLEAGLSAPAAIMVGVVNAAGGGLLRDVLTREEPLLFKPGQFYVLASLAGCILFVCLAYRAVVSPRHAELISMTTIFVLRILAIIFNWRTAPLQPWFAAPASSGEIASSDSPPNDRQKDHERGG
jgi:uncharacterized membrane protein YeiH